MKTRKSAEKNQIPATTQPHPTKKVTIIIPAHNEKIIYQSIQEVYNTMRQTRWDFEIITVVDGKVSATDTTFSDAKKAVKLDPTRIFVYGYDVNKGKGYAVRYGMARATGDYISFIDAGLDINPNGISMVLEHMEWYGADIIVGSKKHPASKVKYPFVRKIYSFAYHFLVWLMFDLHIKDTQTGLKVYKREVLEKVLPRLSVKKFAFDIELLSVAHKLGFSKIYEAPVDVKMNFSASHFSTGLIFNKHVRDMLYDTIAIFYRMNFLKYYDDDSKRKWVYDKDLEMRVNTGELEQ